MTDKNEVLDLVFENGDIMTFDIGFPNRTAVSIVGIKENIYTAVNGIFSLTVCEDIILSVRKKDIVGYELMDEENEPWNRLLTRDLTLVTVGGRDINVPYVEDETYFNRCETIKKWDNGDELTIRISRNNSKEEEQHG